MNTITEPEPTIIEFPSSKAGFSELAWKIGAAFYGLFAYAFFVFFFIALAAVISLESDTSTLRNVLFLTPIHALRILLVLALINIVVEQAFADGVIRLDGQQQIVTVGRQTVGSFADIDVIRFRPIRDLRANSDERFYLSIRMASGRKLGATQLLSIEEAARWRARIREVTAIKPLTEEVAT